MKKIKIPTNFDLDSPTLYMRLVEYNLDYDIYTTYYTKHYEL